MGSSLAHKIIVCIAIVYTAFLTWGSLTSAPQNVDAPENMDKVMHLAAYFGLSLLWLIYGWIRAQTQKLSVKAMVGIAISVVFYGIIIEILQGTFTTDRMADGWDVLANSLGVFLAIVVFIMGVNKSERLKSIF